MKVVWIVVLLGVIANVVSVFGKRNPQELEGRIFMTSIIEKKITKTYSNFLSSLQIVTMVIDVRMRIVEIQHTRDYVHPHVSRIEAYGFNTLVS